MAQNVTVAGASYSDVPAVELPKTGGGTATFVDTTIASDAASASDILNGKKAYVNGSLVTGTASGGGGFSALYEPAFKANNFIVQYIAGHVKLQAVNALNGAMIGLRYFGDGVGNVNNQNTWFTIPNGASVAITYSNVVNTSNATWNANLRKASASTSLSFGIGDGTHLSGASVNVTTTSEQNVGAYFLYVTMSSGSVLEFDVEMTVDGVRYL